MSGTATVARAAVPDTSAFLRRLVRQGYPRLQLAVLDHVLTQTLALGRDWSEPITPAQFARAIHATEAQALAAVEKLVTHGRLLWRDGDRYRVEVER